MATKTYEIRPATRDDLPAIHGIYNWAVNQTFATIDSEPLDSEEAEAWWQTHASRNIVLVAVEEGGVIGWARLLPWKQRGFDVVEDLVYVDPVHQGRGVGRDLLGRLIEVASERPDWRTIVATVATDNRGGLKLHEAMGFKPVGTIKDGAYKFDRWMDITLLQRPLRED
ncbi:MAG TPA: GNAT family N-acetyltransferase [Candidatus Dormibacteraeota bacterium]